ncbi:MAG: FtsX-like permease family protein [Bacteroides sp.]|nr:FtsX-like permease family protein [Bacteroides sp.]
MKSALRKNALIEIFKTKSRFLSIFTIVAIGIAFFAGIKNTAPDMRNSADSYYKLSNLAHFRLVSTLGFTEEDIGALESLDGVKVYPGYFADVMIENGEQDEIVRVMSLAEYGKNNEVNSLKLEEGRFPENKNECIVDSGGLISQRHVGESVIMFSGDGSDIGDTLSVTEYEVVGTFISPSYIDKSSRGNTTIGNGNISTVIYIPEECFSTEVYTELYVTADALSELKAYSDEYGSENDRLTELLEAVGENREIERYDEILSEAGEEIEKAEKELAEAKEKAESELSDAKKELDGALKEIEDGERGLKDAQAELEEAKNTLNDSRGELDYNWSLYYSGVDEFNERIDKARVQLAEQRRQLEDAYGQYRTALNEYNESVRQYKAGAEQHREGLSRYEEGYSYYTLLDGYHKGYIDIYGLAAALGLIDPSAAEELAAAQSGEGIVILPSADNYDNLLVNDLAASLPSADEVSAALAELELAKAELDGARAELNAVNEQLLSAGEQINQTGITLNEGFAQLSAAEQTLEAERISGQQTLDDSRKQLEDGEAEYEKGVEEYRRGEIDYADGVVELQEGRDKYNDGLKEYEKGRSDADREIAAGEQKIRDAKRELQELENPTWYVFDRTSNTGYSEYGENAERINNIASVFPVFFILVAGLVCLTTMTRMVEEQRSQIGTLKALGYTNGQIVSQYMFYALSATLLGALFGAAAGQKLFPFVIIKAYGMIYSLSELVIPTDWLLTALSAVAAAAAVALTVYFSCRSELSEQPAQLMRPKAPRAGKKILLDRLPVWKRVGFNGKVTARNLFRYKRRMLMTIVGIAGCTALTLTGFALADSISDIIDNQYGELVLYDGFFAYDSVDEGDTRQILGIAEKYNCSAVKYLQKKLSVSSDSRTADAYLVVPESKEELCGLFVFRDRATHELFELYDDRVLIDEKLSLLLDVKAGDNVAVYQDGQEHYTVNVSACVENYPNHYVYMTKEMYTELFGEEPEYNIMAFRARDEGALSDKREQERFASELLATNAVLSVNFRDDLVTTMSTMLEALNSVVGVLIISAGALAFVVLYNLTNINITERIREIATLKVMGFYDTEVDSYIFRENIILTLMGIAAGLFGGTFLAKFIIQTAEIDLVMFGREISAMSYVYSALITLVFSIVVVLCMHGHLKKVDMIEALKSVE